MHNQLTIKPIIHDYSWGSNNWIFGYGLTFNKIFWQKLSWQIICKRLILCWPRRDIIPYSTSTHHSTEGPALWKTPELHLHLKSTRRGGLWSLGWSWTRCRLGVNSAVATSSQVISDVCRKVRGFKPIFVVFDWGLWPAARVLFSYCIPHKMQFLEKFRTILKEKFIV